jgi:hypothetical protein
MLVVVAVVWLSTSMAQVHQRYEVKTRVYSTPEYRTEATRAMDAYERVMERYMDVTEKNFEGISGDIGYASGAHRAAPGHPAFAGRAGGRSQRADSRSADRTGAVAAASLIRCVVTTRMCQSLRAL